MSIEYTCTKNDDFCSYCGKFHKLMLTKDLLVCPQCGNVKAIEEKHDPPDQINFPSYSYVIHNINLANY